MKTASACFLMRWKKLRKDYAPACSTPPTACSICSGAIWTRIIPRSSDVPQDQRPRVIQDLYDRMDDLIGRVMQQIDDQTLLLVISDHGFKSFTRCMNLNAWLHQNGYLALKDGKSESGDWFEDVDWSRTRAYTMGLNGLYLNLKGREREGIVEAGAEAEALKEELRSKLDGLVDPASGKSASPECSTATPSTPDRMWTMRPT